MKGGWGAGKILSALDFYLDKPLQVVVVSPATGGAKDFEAAFHRAFVPNRIFVVATEGRDLDAQAKIVPAAEDKRARGGKTTAYVCREQICELPTSDPKVFAAQLAKVEPLFELHSPAPLPIVRRKAAAGR